MKKPTHKLALRPQTLRLLASDQLEHIAGGAERAVPGFIMKDTIIIRTGG